MPGRRSHCPRKLITFSFEASSQAKSFEGHVFERSTCELRKAGQTVTRLHQAHLPVLNPIPPPVALGHGAKDRSSGPKGENTPLEPALTTASLIYSMRVIGFRSNARQHRLLSGGACDSGVVTNSCTTTPPARGEHECYNRFPAYWNPNQFFCNEPGYGGRDLPSVHRSARHHRCSQ